MEYTALATGIRVALLSGMTGSAIMEYSQGKEKKANNKFLSYAMRLADIESVLVGGGRAKLNADIMMNLDIAIPSFNEQEQIGAYFSNLDNLITLHQREWKGKRLWIIINCLLNTIKNG